tara:strand:+ start:89 stop:505 length:417 start_codon:yes stop_codon:yes gene_type:complete
MKEKMTLTIVCAFIIGIIYYGSASIETSTVDVVTNNTPTPQLEDQSLDFIMNDISAPEVTEEVELSSMDTCVLDEMDTDLLSFSEAFGYFRHCLGSDSSFQWKGTEYTTLLSEKVIIQVADSVQVEEKPNDNEISQIR